MRDTILICHFTKWFVVVYYAMQNYRPVFRGNTVFRLLWPSSPLVDYQRRAGVKCFVVGEHVLNPKIQYTCRFKEDVENW